MDRGSDRIQETGIRVAGEIDRDVRLRSDRADDFAALNATVVGISAQDVGSHEKFMASNSLTVPLLADAGGAVAKSYGAHGRLGTKRAVIVIDEQGIVRHRHDHLLGLDYQTVDQLREALEKLPAAA